MPGMTVSSPAGQVVDDAEGLRLVYVREWDQPVRRVWSAVTDPDRLGRWFGRWTGDPSSGTVLLTLTGEGDGAEPSPVTVDACEPPHRLAVTTGGTGAERRWPLEVTLTATAAGGTSLRFEHRLGADDDVPSTGVGWHYYLDRLDAVVRDEVPTDAWDDYFPALAERYPAPAGRVSSAETSGA
jgi:uncharacterized protein YndB with AHSA1/START domain